MRIRPGYRLLLQLGNRLSSIQSILAFERWKGHPQFENDRGMGRVALLAALLSLIFGVHLVLCLQLVLVRSGLFLPREMFSFLSDERLQLALQWTVYVMGFTGFHLCEFFTTAVFNPSVTSADSFMVNHSKPYTAAALVSLIEFTTRITFFPDQNSQKLFFIGIIFMVGGQLCRSLAMITCGESFNHYIQQDKKENHVLVTHGIYGILRHPSYVGFFYWAVGTQLVLCNPISLILYVPAAWTFMRYRIAYEEGTLRQHFPDGAYEKYAARTYLGIPFLGLAMSFDAKEK